MQISMGNTATMTAADLLKDQLDDAGHQLTKVMEGMPDKGLDHKITPDSMSPRDQIAHLCEAYEACKVNGAGGKYEWGTYKAPTEKSELMSEFDKQRGAAVNQTLSNATPEAIKLASDYILGHDYYHVGQLCLARLAVEPDWNFYTIYRE